MSEILTDSVPPSPLTTTPPGCSPDLWDQTSGWGSSSGGNKDPFAHKVDFKQSESHCLIIYNQVNNLNMETIRFGCTYLLLFLLFVFIHSFGIVLVN